MEIKKDVFLGGFRLHTVDTKFRRNRSAVSDVYMETQTFDI